MAFVYWIHLPEHTDITTEGYVGITSKTVEERFSRHLKDSKRPSKNHITLYKAINKYNDSIVVTTILESSIEYARFIENNLRPNARTGWNIVPGGAVSPSTAFTQETRNKISKAGKGRVKSPEEIAKIKAALTGKKRPKEIGLNLSLQRKGKPRPQDFIDKGKETAYNHPWRNRTAKKDVWAIADKLYAAYFFGQKSLTKLASLFELPQSTLNCIHKRFKNGWVPIHDVYWLNFVKCYEEEHDSTRTN